MWCLISLFQLFIEVPLCCWTLHFNVLCITYCNVLCITYFNVLCITYFNVLCITYFVYWILNNILDFLGVNIQIILFSYTCSAFTWLVSEVNWFISNNKIVEFIIALFMQPKLMVGSSVDILKTSTLSSPEEQILQTYITCLLNWAYTCTCRYPVRP